MQKSTFQELKDLFLVAKAPKLGKIGKHQASKKGFRHRVKLSKGELNHQAHQFSKNNLPE